VVDVDVVLVVCLVARWCMEVGTSVSTGSTG